MSIEDFHQFLKATKASHRTSRQIVLGNESADLDSVVSSLMMAYYQNLASPSDSIPLPVINIPGNELRLRADILFLLDRLRTDPVNLTFIDEINLSDSTTSHTLSLTLVDHNQLAPHQAHLIKQVSTIIDHHIESGRYNQTVKKAIQPVGSTATLIWSLFAQNRPHELDRDLARFLLAPILVDTTLLGDPVKTTDLDQEAAQWLQAKAQINTKVFYDLLQAKKRDLTHLTAQEVLKKDFKAWNWNAQTGGISSTPERVEQLLKTKSELLGATKKLAVENNFDFYMIMGSGNKPDPCRDLLIWCLDHQLIERLTAHLQKSAIGLEKVPFPSHKTQIQADFYYFRQINALFSRKQMATELHSFFSIN